MSDSLKTNLHKMRFFNAKKKKTNLQMDDYVSKIEKSKMFLRFLFSIKKNTLEEKCSLFQFIICGYAMEMQKVGQVEWR